MKGSQLHKLDKKVIKHITVNLCLLKLCLPQGRRCAKTLEEELLMLSRLERAKNTD